MNFATLPQVWRIIGGLLALLWVIEGVNLLTGHALSYQLGIVPRTVKGLLGIIFSPFLHFGLRHLICNSVPFVVLGGLVLLQGRMLFVEVSTFVLFFAGLAVWLFAGGGVHAGASLMIFGWFGFLLAHGFYGRDFAALATAILVFLIYGGLIFGIVPGVPFVSWQGHLAGFLAGIVAARLHTLPD